MKVENSQNEKHKQIMESVCKYNKPNEWYSKPFKAFDKNMATNKHILIVTPMFDDSLQDYTQKVAHLYPIKQSNPKEIQVSEFKQKMSELSVEIEKDDPVDNYYHLKIEDCFFEAGKAEFILLVMDFLKNQTLSFEQYNISPSYKRASFLIGEVELWVASDVYQDGEVFKEIN